jgi:hypothetical protein
MSKKKSSLKRCAEEFDRAIFDALVSKKELDLRNEMQTKGPSKHFLRLSKLYGQGSAYTVYAAEKVMTKIISKRQEIDKKPIPYSSWAKDQARLRVAEMYRGQMHPQKIVKPTVPHGRRWSYGFAGSD